MPPLRRLALALVHCAPLALVAPPADAGPGWSYEDRALSFSSSGFGLVVESAVQARYAYDTRDDAGAFELERARSELSGWIAREWLRFEVQIDWTGAELELPERPGEPPGERTDLIDDLFVEVRGAGQSEIRVRAGQFVPAFGRQRPISSLKRTLPERSLLEAELVGGREIGLELAGRLAGGTLRYALGLYNGQGKGELRNVGGEMQWNARLAWEPRGEVRSGESDLRQDGELLWSAGASFERNGGRLLRGGTARWSSGGLDFLAQRHGVSLLLEVVVRDETLGGARSDVARGLTSQIAWFAIPKRFELALRASRLSGAGDLADASETFAGVNFYLRGHDLKAQLGWLRLDQTSEGATDRWIAQTQVRF